MGQIFFEYFYNVLIINTLNTFRSYTRVKKMEKLVIERSSNGITEMNDFGTPCGFDYAQPPILRNSNINQIHSLSNLLAWWSGFRCVAITFARNLDFGQNRHVIGLDKFGQNVAWVMQLGRFAVIGKNKSNG